MYWRPSNQFRLKDFSGEGDIIFSSTFIFERRRLPFRSFGMVDVNKCLEDYEYYQEFGIDREGIITNATREKFTKLWLGIIAVTIWIIAIITNTTTIYCMRNECKQLNTFKAFVRKASGLKESSKRLSSRSQPTGTRFTVLEEKTKL